MLKLTELQTFRFLSNKLARSFPSFVCTKASIAVSAPQDPFLSDNRSGWLSVLCDDIVVCVRKGELTDSSSTLAANGSPSVTRKIIVDLTIFARCSPDLEFLWSIDTGLTKVRFNNRSLLLSLIDT